MYGFIYNTLRSLVVDNHGEEKWLQICEKAGVEITHGILNTRYYDEAVLGRVGESAAEILGIPLEQILESFGNFFFETIKKSGHSNMLRTLGHTLHGFLMNLDSLHDHLSSTYPEMQPPSFRCEKLGRHLLLHYYSLREGLHPIVTGIVKAVAQQYFKLDVEIKMEKYERTQEQLCHYYVFKINVKGSRKDDLERLTGEMVPSTSEVDLPRVDILPTVDSETELTIAAPTVIRLSNAFLPVEWECPMSGRSESTGQMISVDSYDQETVDHSCPILSPTTPEPTVEDYDALREHLLRIGLPVGGGGLHARLPHPLLPSLPVSQVVSRRGSAFVTELETWPITPHIFQNCFPFHFIFDKDLVIRHMGVSISRLFSRAVANEAKISDFFELIRPSVKLTYSNIRSSIHNIFILQTRRSTIIPKHSDPTRKALQFRGQMVPTSSRDGTPILFLGSPRISSIEELEMQGLYLSDIPIHDVTRDLILLNKHFQVEVSFARELEETKQALMVEKARVMDEKNRADRLLHAMLPPSIAAELKSGVEVSATEHPAVTILFSDIKGFTEICKDCRPMEVVGMLNQLYTLFDNLIEKHQVYKVETIGDAYMVAAGLLETSKNHAEAVTNMAFDMRAEARRVTKPTNNEALQIRIGIHTGPVVAGVVGKKMPRYCLFGDTVNTASRMESHGEPDHIHISEATYRLLKRKPYTFYSRGKIRVKGLGERQTYFVESVDDHDGTTRIMVQSESQDSDSSSSSTTPGISKSRSRSFIKYSRPMAVKPSSQSLARTASSNPFHDPELSQLERVATPLEMVKPQRKEGMSSSPIVRNQLQVADSLEPVLASTPENDNQSGRVSRLSNSSAIFMVHKSSTEDLSQPNGMRARSWTAPTPSVATEKEKGVRKHSKQKSKKHHRKCRIS